MGEVAWHELYAHKIVDSAGLVPDERIPPELSSDVFSFLEQLRALHDPVIDRNLDIATVKADAPKLQSTETVILAVAGGVALVVFAVRFGQGTIQYQDGKLSVKLAATDSEHTTANLAAIGKFLSRVLPFVGNGDASPPDGNA